MLALVDLWRLDGLPRLVEHHYSVVLVQELVLAEALLRIAEGALSFDQMLVRELRVVV